MGRAELIKDLRNDILRLQGLKSCNGISLDTGLGPLRESFPDGTFPLGAVHEFLSAEQEAYAATSGFISGLLSTIMGTHGVAVWVSARRSVFAPALKSYGIQPDRVIFLDLQKEKDVLWAMEESLKCGALAAVIGEVDAISFTESRRLQLAVERSTVTGFIIRRKCYKLNTTACVSRWKVVPISSHLVDDLPGVGFPGWRVQLMRIRNGKPGEWNIHWMKNGFKVTEKLDQSEHQASRLAGSLKTVLDKAG